MTRPAHLTVVPPPAIGRLATIGDNFPVPWITLYSSPTGVAVTTFAAGSTGPVVGCTCRYGIGMPVFGQPCLRRQRRAMVHMLCNTCGTPVEGPERLFVGTQESHSIEPPIHPECAVFAALACPTLRRDLDQVPVLLAREHVLADRVITRFDEGQPVHGLLPHGTPRGNSALQDHIALFKAGHTRSMTLAEWLATEAPALQPIA